MSGTETLEDDIEGVVEEVEGEESPLELSDDASEASAAASSSLSENPETRKELKHRQKEEDARHKKLMIERKQQLDLLRREQNTKLEQEAQDSKSDRLRFLLQQTEIFTHFISSAVQAPKKNRKGSATATGAASSSGRRGRLDEEEEDAELIQEAPLVQATRLIVSPGFIQGTMREYQVQGLNWLIGLYDNGINGILADEMGLGKTLQTISLLGYLKHMRGVDGPHIVIGPKSTLSNWHREIKRFCPTLEAFVFHGDKEQRAEIRRTKLVPGKFDVVCTTYEMAIIEKAALSKFTWRYLIIDEAHRIKNENSILSKVVRLYHSQYRLLITGTPLQNNLHELWALLNFLLPDVFSSSEDFDTWFALDGQDQEAQTSVVQKLHKVLRPFLLRRLKHEVETSLPPKEEIKLYVGLSEMQLDWYKKILSKDIDAVNVGAAKTRLLNLAMQLRKCTNHPYLFAGAEPGPPYTTDEHLIFNSGKMILLDKLLTRLKEQGSRVLIFSQMTRLLDILEDYMVFRGHQYCRIDGQTSYELRESQLDDFNAEGSSKFVFLLSTRAGGLGINLATADIVILYDSDWNPQMDLQAQDRAHRIGQKKPVFVYRFVTEESIEERIVARAESKLRLDALVIQQGRLTANSDQMGGDELLSMIRFGAQKIFNTRGSTVTDEDIERILARGKQKTAELNEEIASKLKEGAPALLNFSLGVEDSRSLYEFQGEDYRSKDRSSISSGWIAPPKRDRSKANYSVDAYYGGLMRGQSSSGPKKKNFPKPPKQLIIKDFQFYPQELKKLFEIELQAYHRHVEWCKENPDALDDDEEFVLEGEVPVQKKPSNRPDFGGLTPQQVALRETYRSQGFANWSRREYQHFLKGCERFGRDALDSITAEIGGTKTLAEVKAYHHVFFKRYHELDGADRIIKNIEKGEERLQRIRDITILLRKKVGGYSEPLKQMKIAYGTTKGKQYSPEEDVFLLYATHVLGYGRWEELRIEVRMAWQFRFNWFIKSRTPQELGRRVDTLIRLVEKEFEESDEIESKSKAKFSNAKRARN